MLIKLIIVCNDFGWVHSLTLAWCAVLISTGCSWDVADVPAFCDVCVCVCVWERERESECVDCSFTSMKKTNDETTSGVLQMRAVVKSSRLWWSHFNLEWNHIEVTSMQLMTTMVAPSVQQVDCQQRDTQSGVMVRSVWVHMFRLGHLAVHTASQPAAWTGSGTNSHALIPYFEAVIHRGGPVAQPLLLASQGASTRSDEEVRAVSIG